MKINKTVILLSDKASDNRQGLLSRSNTSSGLIFSSHCVVSFKLIVTFITSEEESSTVAATAAFSCQLFFTMYSLPKKCQTIPNHVEKNVAKNVAQLTMFQDCRTLVLLWLAGVNFQNITSSRRNRFVVQFHYNVTSDWKT